MVQTPFPPRKYHLSQSVLVLRLKKMANVPPVIARGMAHQFRWIARGMAHQFRWMARDSPHTHIKRAALSDCSFNVCINLIFFV